MVSISPPAPRGAGSGRQVLLPRRDGRRGHAVRVQLPVRHDRPDRRSTRSARRSAPTAADAARPRRSSTPWQMLAVVMLLAGFAFKIAAVPLHFYAGDVYQGAATPVTAFLVVRPQDQRLRRADQAALRRRRRRLGVPPEIVAKLLWIAGRADDDRRQRAGPAAVQRQARASPTARSRTAATCWSASPRWPRARRRRRRRSSDGAAGRAVLPRGLRDHERRRVRRADAAARRGRCGRWARPRHARPARDHRRDLRRPRRPRPPPPGARAGDGRLLLQPDRPAADRRVLRQALPDPARALGTRSCTGWSCSR